MILGIAVFAFFSMMIERALNDFVLSNATTVGWLSNPAVFVAYGALAAGICEEVGRFIGMRWLIARAARARSRNRAPRSPTASATAARKRGSSACWCRLQWIVYAVLENRGQLDEHFSERADRCADAPAPGARQPDAAIRPRCSSIERVAAFVFQLGLSVLMWQMLRERFRYTLPLMIAAHALIDLPAALFQAPRDSARSPPMRCYLVLRPDRRARADAVLPRMAAAANRRRLDAVRRHPFGTAHGRSYQYDCPSADIEMLARVISDLFPEQTQFTERLGRRRQAVARDSLRRDAFRLDRAPHRDRRAFRPGRARALSCDAGAPARAQLRGAARVCRSDARLARGSVCERGGRAAHGRIEMGEDFA